MCAGFCGEPCPPLCRQCDAERLEEQAIFYGADSSINPKDRRYVLLVDCGHVFESGTLDKWFKLVDDEEQTMVKLIECPQCCTPVRNTFRYQRHIKRRLHAIEAVKDAQIFGQVNNDDGVFHLRDQLEQKVAQKQTQLFEYKIYADWFQMLVDRLREKQPQSYALLASLINTFEFVEK